MLPVAPVAAGPGRAPPDRSGVVGTIAADYNKRMIRPVAAVALALSLAAIGCGGTDPYIFQKKEFDRGRPDFGKPVTDRTQVTICYNGARSTDGQVARLAEEECARFGKRAEPSGDGFGDCPLLVPIAAHFVCQPAGAASGEAAATSSAAPPATLPPGAKGSSAPPIPIE